MATRNYSNTAPPLSLTAAVTTTSTSLSVSSTTGYPAAPFILGLERGTANEEVVLCTAVTATAFTVTRGYDNTSAKAHNIGTSVEHTVAAIDYREATRVDGYGTPGGSAVGDTAAAGTAESAARSDHRHAREAFGAVTAQTGYGAASGNGAATTPSRSDHTHGTPALPTPGDIGAAPSSHGHGNTEAGLITGTYTGNGAASGTNQQVTTAPFYCSHAIITGGARTVITTRNGNMLALGTNAGQQKANNFLGSGNQGFYASNDATYDGLSLNVSGVVYTYTAWRA